jgi:methylated-DNA-[protein]-cysteine S-methyltransferase
VEVDSEPGAMEKRAQREEALAAQLRDRGLRVTPQRRATLAALGPVGTHLTADEVYERVRAELPEIAKGTVYSTLGELVRVGLVRVFGRAEPVRYEPNLDRSHQHFRCLGCDHIYNVHLTDTERFDVLDKGFVVQGAQIELQGICPDCVALERSLVRAARRHPPNMGRPSAASKTDGMQVSYAVIDSPFGSLLAASTPRGLVRLAWDADKRQEAVLVELSEWVSPVVEEAPGGLDAVRRQLEEYFDGTRRDFRLPIDWALARGPGRRVLKTLMQVPCGKVLTYADVTGVLGTSNASVIAGEALGGNPIPIVIPCHRVVRSDGELGEYSGGTERKEALLRLEGALRR